MPVIGETLDCHGFEKSLGGKVNNFKISHSCISIIKEYKWQYIQIFKHFHISTLYIYKHFLYAMTLYIMLYNYLLSFSFSYIYLIY